MYEHFAGKYANGLFVEDVFIEFIAVAMPCLVLHKCAVVDVLFAVANNKAGDVCVGTGAIECNIYSVAGKAVGEGYVAVVEAAVGCLAHEQMPHTAVAVACLFKLINVERCSLPDEHFAHLCGDCFLGGGGVVADEQACFCPLFEYYEQAAVRHHIHLRLYETYYLYGSLNLGVCRNVEQYAILYKGGVELCYAVAIGCQFVVVRGYKLFVAVGYAVETAEEYSLWQFVFFVGCLE